MLPELPQDARDRQARRDRLARARERVAISTAWPPGVATLATLPLRDQFPPSFLARLQVVALELAGNHASIGFRDDGLRGALREFVEGFELEIPSNGLHAAALKAMRNEPSTRPKAWDEWHRYFAAFDPPPLVQTLHRAHHDGRTWDRAFAWQRIAGPNPMMLHRIDALPDAFAVDGAAFARAAAHHGWGADDGLDAALAEGRAFLCDYAALDGVRTGSHAGVQKHIAAPFALFVAERGGGPLWPVAIQCAQRPSADDPVFTPADGFRWNMARNAVQAADACMHEVVVHLARTHLVMEAVDLCCERELDVDHPLHILLRPHLQHTHAINHQARDYLIAPGGIVDTLFAPAIDETARLVRAGIDGFDLQGAVPDDALGRRGLLDVDTLAQHPYRDDLRTLWPALRRFVDGYVRLYYRGETDVAGDGELRAFVQALSADDGGRLRPLRPVHTLDELVDLFACIVLTASAQHAAVNYSQWPYFSVPANAAGALWRPHVRADTPDTQQVWLDHLPPWDMAGLLSDTVKQLSAIQVNTLGAYDRRDFVDQRVWDLVETFDRDLACVQDRLEQRDRDRFLPYPFLQPHRVPASIHI
ncbi:MAG: hypothetical protein H6742_13790 [Alphaproteobacteria bacterium]|nr:hypothetical protein [Alphaproteobacteria bacterium]